MIRFLTEVFEASDHTRPPNKVFVQTSRSLFAHFSISADMTASIDPKADPFAAREGRSLSWSNVSMTVQRKGMDDLQVLSGIDGSIRSSELCCILGHSGSGKTSLFSVLAGKVVTSGGICVKREVKIDGTSIDPSSTMMKLNIVFVAQCVIHSLRQPPPLRLFVSPPGFVFQAKLLMLKSICLQTRSLPSSVFAKSPTRLSVD